MVDLHIHTNFSDGTDDYISVLKKAQEKQLSCISITDHENCNVYDELNKIDINKYYAGNIIYGVELKTKVDKITIELLGYGIDPNIMKEGIKKIYPSFDEKDSKEAIQLVNVCKKVGIKIDDDILKNYDKDKYAYSSTYIHKEITKNPENKVFFKNEKSWKSDRGFYRKEMTNPNSIFYIDNTDSLPTIGEVIELIRKAGGLVFVPHIYNYGENSEKIFNHITKNYKVDGFECYYSKFSKEQTEFLVNYCRQNDLYISGGSDYHGLYKPKIQLGNGLGDLQVPEEAIKPWASKVYKTFKT